MSPKLQNQKLIKALELRKTIEDRLQIPQWFMERTKRITSSNFSPICKGLKEPGKFAHSLTENKCFYSASTDHGKKYESHAVAAYDEGCDVVTKHCGIFVSKDYPYLAASPDRIVDDQKILEVKCPYTSRNKFISHSIQSLFDRL